MPPIPSGTGGLFQVAFNPRGSQPPPQRYEDDDSAASLNYAVSHIGPSTAVNRTPAKFKDKLITLLHRFGFEDVQDDVVSVVMPIIDRIPQPLSLEIILVRAELKTSWLSEGNIPRDHESHFKFPFYNLMMFLNRIIGPQWNLSYHTVPNTEMLGTPTSDLVFTDVRISISSTQPYFINHDEMIWRKGFATVIYNPRKLDPSAFLMELIVISLYPFPEIYPDEVVAMQPYRIGMWESVRHLPHAERFEDEVKACVNGGPKPRPVPRIKYTRPSLVRHGAIALASLPVSEAFSHTAIPVLLPLWFFTVCVVLALLCSFIYEWLRPWFKSISLARLLPRVAATTVKSSGYMWSLWVAIVLLILDILSPFLDDYIKKHKQKMKRKYDDLLKKLSHPYEDPEHQCAPFQMPEFPKKLLTVDHIDRDYLLLHPDANPVYHTDIPEEDKRVICEVFDLPYLYWQLRKFHEDIAVLNPEQLANLLNQPTLQSAASSMSPVPEINVSPHVSLTIQNCIQVLRTVFNTVDTKLFSSIIGSIAATCSVYMIASDSRLSRTEKAIRISAATIQWSTEPGTAAIFKGWETIMAEHQSAFDDINEAWVKFRDFSESPALSAFEKILLEGLCDPLDAICGPGTSLLVQKGIALSKKSVGLGEALVLFSSQVCHFYAAYKSTKSITMALSTLNTNSQLEAEFLAIAKATEEYIRGVETVSSKDFSRLLDRCATLRAGMMEYKRRSTGAERNQMMMRIERIDRWSVFIVSKLLPNLPKVMPLTVSLAGPGGIGKSVMTKRLAIALCHFRELTLAIAARPWYGKWDLNCTSFTRCITIDDVGMTCGGNTSDPETLFGNILGRLNNTTVSNFMKAEAEQKEGNLNLVELIIMNSNDKTFAVFESVKDFNAAKRRCGFTIEVRVLPQFADKDGKLKKDLPSSPDAILNPYCEYQYYELVTDASKQIDARPLTGWIGHRDMMDLIYDFAAKHFAHEDRMISEQTQLAEFCKVCRRYKGNCCCSRSDAFLPPSPPDDPPAPPVTATLAPPNAPPISAPLNHAGWKEVQSYENYRAPSLRQRRGRGRGRGGFGRGNGNPPLQTVLERELPEETPLFRKMVNAQIKSDSVYGPVKVETVLESPLAQVDDDAPYLFNAQSPYGEFQSATEPRPFEHSQCAASREYLPRQLRYTDYSQVEFQADEKPWFESLPKRKPWWKFWEPPELSAVAAERGQVLGENETLDGASFATGSSTLPSASLPVSQIPIPENAQWDSARFLKELNKAQKPLRQGIAHEDVQNLLNELSFDSSKVEFGLAEFCMERVLRAVDEVPYGVLFTNWFMQVQIPSIEKTVHDYLEWDSRTYALATSAFGFLGLWNPVCLAASAVSTSSWFMSRILRVRSNIRAVSPLPTKVMLARKAEAAAHVLKNWRWMPSSVHGFLGLTAGILLLATFMLMTYRASTKAFFQSMTATLEDRIEASLSDGPWAAPYRNVSPKSEASSTCNPERLEEKVKNAMVLIRRIDQPGYTQGLMLQSGVLLLNHHFVKSLPPQCDVEVILSAEPRIAKTITLEYANMSHNIERDWSLVHVYAFGDRPDLLKFCALKPLGGKNMVNVIGWNDRLEKTCEAVEVTPTRSYVGNTLYESYRSSLNGFKGACGRVITHRAKGCSIEGVHFAGTSYESMFTPLLQKELKFGISELRKIDPSFLPRNEQAPLIIDVGEEPHPKSLVNHLPDGSGVYIEFNGDYPDNRKYVCNVEPNPGRGIAERLFGFHNAWISPLFWIKKDARMEAILGSTNNAYLPVKLMQRAYADLWNEKLPRIKESLRVKKWRRTPYDLLEVCNGIMGDKYRKALNWTTSAGAPYFTQKKNLFVETEEGWVPKPELLALVTQCEDRMLAGVASGVPYHASPKSEPVKKGKESTRIFYAESVSMQIVLLKYLGPVFDFMVGNPGLFHHVIGLNPFSHEWYEEMQEVYGTIPGTGSSIDYTKFDILFAKQTLTMAARFIVDISLIVCPEVPQVLVEALLADILYRPVIYFGSVLFISNLMPSGSLFTALLNSLRGNLNKRLYFHYEYLDVDKPPKYSDYHADKNLGDDNLSGQKQIDPRFSLKRFGEFLSMLGYRVTGADKKPLVDAPGNAWELDFLKRISFFNEDCGRVVSILAPPSIQRPFMIRVPSSNISPLDSQVDICRTLLTETFYYGRKTFEGMQVRAFQYLKEMGVSVLPEDLTAPYDVRLREDRRKYRSITRPPHLPTTPPFSFELPELQSGETIVPRLIALSVLPKQDWEGFKSLLLMTLASRQEIRTCESVTYEWCCLQRELEYQSDLLETLEPPGEEADSLPSLTFAGESVGYGDIASIIERSVPIGDIGFGESDTNKEFFIHPWEEMFRDEQIGNLMQHRNTFRADLEVSFMYSTDAATYGSLCISYLPQINRFRDRISREDKYSPTGKMMLAMSRPHIFLKFGDQATSGKMTLPWAHPTACAEPNSVDARNWGRLTIFVFSGLQNALKDNPYAVVRIFGRFVNISIDGATSMAFQNYVPALSQSIMNGDSSGHRVLSLDPGARVSSDPRFAPERDFDPLEFKHYLQRESYVAMFEWSQTMIREQLLYSILVNPFLQHLSQSNSFLSSQALVGVFFEQWHGTVSYRFEVLAPANAGGKLLFMHEPRVRAQDTSVDKRRNKSYVLDLAVSRSLVIDVGWAQALPLLNVNVWDPAMQGYVRPSDGRTGLFDVLPNSANGRLIVRQFTPLMVPGESTEIVARVKVTCWMSPETVFSFYNNHIIACCNIATTDTGTDTVYVPVPPPSEPDEADKATGRTTTYDGWETEVPGRTPAPFSPPTQIAPTPAPVARLTQEPASRPSPLPLNTTQPSERPAPSAQPSTPYELTAYDAIDSDFPPESIPGLGLKMVGLLTTAIRAFAAPGPAEIVLPIYETPRRMEISLTVVGEIRNIDPPPDRVEGSTITFYTAQIDSYRLKRFSIKFDAVSETHFSKVVVPVQNGYQWSGFILRPTQWGARAQVTCSGATINVPVTSASGFFNTRVQPTQTSSPPAGDWVVWCALGKILNAINNDLLYDAGCLDNFIGPPHVKWDPTSTYGNARGFYGYTYLEPTFQSGLEFQSDFNTDVVAEARWTVGNNEHTTAVVNLMVGTNIRSFRTILKSPISSTTIVLEKFQSHLANFYQQGRKEKCSPLNLLTRCFLGVRGGVNVTYMCMDDGQFAVYPASDKYPEPAISHCEYADTRVNPVLSVTYPWQGSALYTTVTELTEYTLPGLYHVKRGIRNGNSTLIRVRELVSIADDFSLLTFVGCPPLDLCPVHL